MKSKIRWGVLSTAKIAREKVIPAIQQSQYGVVEAISSRTLAQAKQTAALLDIKKAYGSYQELVDDEQIDAIYIPLPNHLHVRWAVKCLAAGKHILIEKPIGLSAKDAETLLQASKKYPHLKVMEGFMYRFHPQWIYTEGLIKSKWLGKLKSVQSFFSYHNIDPNNIRNKVEVGGGGLMDIGCYCISIARFLFGNEPLKVIGNIEFDTNMHTDCFTSAMMVFQDGSSSFTCSTQLTPYQRVNVIGTTGRIEIEIPFNPLPNQQTKISLFSKDGQKDIFFDAIDQYSQQADEFSKTILNDTIVPFAMEDALNNMKVIDAVFESDRSKKWVDIS